MANAAPFHFEAVKYFAWHVTACARKKINGEGIFICRREGGHDELKEQLNGPTCSRKPKQAIQERPQTLLISSPEDSTPKSPYQSRTDHRSKPRQMKTRYAETV